MDAIVTLIRDNGGIITHELPLINAVAATLPVAQLSALAAHPNVRMIAANGAMQSAGTFTNLPEKKGGNTTESSAPAANTFPDTLNVRPVWAMGLDGTGIGVAVIDSGISPDNDLPNIAAAITFSPGAATTVDQLGHGTHVAGILAGNGADSGGAFRGIAPGVRLLNLKVGNDQGLATEADVVAAMQWVLAHKAEYNIRVVNLSINSTVQASYHVSPLSAAAEILWFNGIVVVTATGNKQEANGFNPVLAAPANDPFVITVGASDEKGDAQRKNDSIASFTANDATAEGFVKPEIMAPGVNIMSVLSANSTWPAQFPNRVTADGQYFRLSGASMSTPMVTGAVALLLQAEPHLTPDQVKYRLLQSAGKVGKARYLDINALITQKTTESANVGIPASQLLWTGPEPVQWQSVNWNAVNWNAVNWNAVNWNAVNWNAVMWNSVSWSD
jgi:serine protease AprX